MEATPQITYFGWWFNAGGWEGLAMIAASLLAIVWGVLNLVGRSQRPALIAGQLFATAAPLVVGMMTAFMALQRWMEMTTASTAPKPSDFGEVVNQAFFAGLSAPLFTLIPLGLGIASVLNRGRRRGSSGEHV